MGTGGQGTRQAISGGTARGRWSLLAGPEGPRAVNGKPFHKFQSSGMRVRVGSTQIRSPLKSADVIFVRRNCSAEGVRKHPKPQGNHKVSVRLFRAGPSPGPPPGPPPRFWRIPSGQLHRLFGFSAGRNRRKKCGRARAHGQPGRARRAGPEQPGCSAPRGSCSARVC